MRHAARTHAARRLRTLRVPRARSYLVVRCHSPSLTVTPLVHAVPYHLAGRRAAGPAGWLAPWLPGRQCARSPCCAHMMHACMHACKHARKDAHALKPREESKKLRPHIALDRVHGTLTCLDLSAVDLAPNSIHSSHDSCSCWASWLAGCSMPGLARSLVCLPN